MKNTKMKMGILNFKKFNDRFIYITYGETAAFGVL